MKGQRKHIINKMENEAGLLLPLFERPDVQQLVKCVVGTLSKQKKSKEIFNVTVQDPLSGQSYMISVNPRKAHEATHVEPAAARE